MDNIHCCKHTSSLDCYIQNFVMITCTRFSSNGEIGDFGVCVTFKSRTFIFKTKMERVMIKKFFKVLSYTDVIEQELKKIGFREE